MMRLSWLRTCSSVRHDACSVQHMCTLRSGGGGAKARRRDREEAKKSRWEKQKTENLPVFSTLLRQIYRKAHPDLLRAKHPELATVNDKSMQLLNGVLTTIKTQNEYPAAIVQNIPFYLLQSEAEGGGTKCVELRIKTAGGDCKRALTQSFELFFQNAAIACKDGSHRFSWEADYFPVPDLSRLSQMQQEQSQE